MATILSVEINSLLSDKTEEDIMHEIKMHNVDHDNTKRLELVNSINDQELHRMLV